MINYGWQNKLEYEINKLSGIHRMDILYEKLHTIILNVS